MYPCFQGYMRFVSPTFPFDPPTQSDTYTFVSLMVIEITVYSIINGMPVSVLGFSSPISTLAASSPQDEIKGYVICDWI